jgi:hypothetical protein
MAMSGQHHARARLFQESTPIPFEEEAGWAPQRFGDFEEELRPVAVVCIRTPDLPAQ